MQANTVIVVLDKITRGFKNSFPLSTLGSKGYGANLIIPLQHLLLLIKVKKRYKSKQQQ